MCVHWCALRDGSGEVLLPPPPPKHLPQEGGFVLLVLSFFFVSLVAVAFYCSELEGCIQTYGA